jgi:acyl phosphate:glycerol-3-phosphate acyltransferase
VTKTYIIVALVSYLLGSIPFGYILVKLFLKQDIRATGSGNIGATNVARSGAKGLAVATLVLDALKGFVAVLIANHIAYSTWDIYVDGYEPVRKLMAIAALLAVVGHMFPIWLKFKGGKGVATAVGAFAVVAPLSIVSVFALFLASVAFTRFVSLGSILAAAAFPIIALFLERISGVPLALISATGLLIILKHHENIRRLIAGTESKFGGKKSIPPPDAMEKQA